ncbi:hypothetical protein [Paenibacillus ottowii]|uniref:hypothetical protein n=1 Tax=Paenibacillus ottowii TaxID=2315729 RepID=UPI0013902514|nr:hypothetical protein [Paenibacillus ottowii]
MMINLHTQNKLDETINILCDKIQTELKKEGPVIDTTALPALLQSASQFIAVAKD